MGRRKVKATTERVTFRTKVGGYGSVLSDSLDSVEDDKRSGNVVADRQRQQQRELRALEKERNATELAEAFPKLRVDDMRQNDGSSGVATAGDGRPSGLDKAEALKKRLLAFDRGDASRNAVHGRPARAAAAFSARTLFL